MITSTIIPVIMGISFVFLVFGIYSLINYLVNNDDNDTDGFAW